jgi:NDP-hexose 4-ketoreductase
MRLLIVGASGFLGTHVRGQATAAGIEIMTAGRSAVAGLPGYLRLDLAADDPARIAATLAEVAPDAVVNCAGATVGDPGMLAAANVSATFALVQAMLLARIPARLVHLGSAAEYGPAEPGVPVSERTHPRPAGEYGVTKLAGTRLVELGITAGIDGVALRIFNPVGPGAPRTSLPGRLVAELHRALEHGTDVRLGSLDAVRDFVDARDVADAVLAAAAAPALPHSVLNIGSGQGTPVRALVKELLAISGCTGAVHEDAPGLPRPQHIPWQQADISCAREDLGWVPRRELGTSLHDLWEASR